MIDFITHGNETSSVIRFKILIRGQEYRTMFEFSGDDNAKIHKWSDWKLYENDNK